MGIYKKRNGNKKNKIEACFEHNLKKYPLVSMIGAMHGCPNGYIMSAVHAWSDHLPFMIKPIHLWILILQGVSTHVNGNAKELRDKWVLHKGKMTLEVKRDGFILGSSKNDWKGVVSEFTEKISEKTVKDTFEILDPSVFSNASMDEKIAVGITIMDMCKKYFRYLVTTRCGFASITLDGTRDDWVVLKEKAVKLLKNKCQKEWADKWIKSLIPILDRFIAAYDGSIDCVFWNAMIKKGSVRGSGGYDYFSGWINTFFPFIGKELVDNPFCFDQPWPAISQKLNTKNTPYYVNIDGSLEYAGGSSPNWRGGDESITGPQIGQYPNGLTACPVEWDYLGITLPMQFVSGFIGYTHDLKNDGIVIPVVGWCMAHTKDQKVVEGILKDKKDADSKRDN